MDSRDQAKALGLEESITCFICKKYLSDAVTLNECLHFFCRRCLINHLNLPSPDSRKCPKCKIGLFEPIYRRDPRLQELVYKLVPEHFWQKIKHITSKKHHHSSSRYSSNSPPSERRIRKRRMLLRLSTQLCSLNEKISLQIVYVPLANVLAANNNNSSTFLNENVVENVEKQVGEQIVKQIENVYNVEQQTPSSSFFPLNIFEKQNKIIGGIEQQQKQHSFNRYFRCSSKVKIQHLKRLLESKLAMTEFYGVYFIDPEFRFVLEDYFTLEDVVQLFSWLRNAPLRLHFTLAQLPPKGDEDRPSALEDMPQLDLESGPMEQVLPIQQQQQSPPPPIIITTTICQDFNEITNKKQIEKNGEKSQEVNNEITKTALSSSLISPSICDNSQHTPLLPHSSKSLQNSITTINSKDVRPSAAFTPPNVSTTMPIPRLSTVGASPLRPVPSLQPTTQQPTNINNNIIKDKPNDGRKRQKNTSNNNIQKKPYQKQEKSKLKNIQQELSEGQQISNSQNLQKETSKPQQIQQEKSKVSQKQKASGERTSLDNGFRNGSSKHTPPPPLTNGSSFINPTIVTNSQQTPQPVVASDYVNFMQNLFQQYHQQQNKQQTSPQFPSFLPANIFGQQTTQQQQQLNSQQMLAMNQMIAMGMFSSGIPFSSEQFSQIPFPFTSTEFLKQNNKKVLQNNNENTTPTKVKKTKSSATSQQNQVIGGNSNHLTKTSTSLSLC